MQRNILAERIPRCGKLAHVREFLASARNVAEAKNEQSRLGSAFNLRHTFSDKAQNFLPEKTTLNLMDYANGTELWKYQWDLIHNPETILLGAYNEAEGAMTDDVFWINYFSRNITIHPDFTIGNDNLNYITPAGKPFVLPMSASVSFSGSFTNKSTNSTEQVAMPRGVLYAFADETGTYYANLTKKNGGQYYFNGYKKAKADGVFKESEVGGGSTHKVVVGIENESCRLYISGANYSFDQVALTKYRGDGPVLTVDALPVELTGHIAANISIPSGKCFPDVWYAIDPLSLDEFENGTYAKYNPYGNDYGLLVKLKDGRFVYSRVVSGGTTEYHVWNGKEWVQTMAPKAGCLSCELSELLTLWSFVQLAKEEGHTALDFVGAIPVVGELADGVNGIWYLVEGDRVNAGFSFASMLPLIGDAGVKGAKYVFKVGKDLKVVAGAAEAFSAIHKALKAKEAGLLVLCMDRSALLMGRHANHVETIRSLCVSVPDVGELEKVLKKLHDMAPEDCAKFLDDLATSDLSKNLEKVNVGLVESWKVLIDGGSNFVKTDLVYLQKFGALNENVKPIIAQFSGGGASQSTLKEFLDDLDADKAFTLFVNDAQNEKIVRGFIGHKLSDDDIVDIGDYIADAGDEAVELSVKWLNRSKHIAQFKRYTEMGRQLNTLIVRDIYQRSGRLFNELSSKTGVPLDILKKYDIFTEVPLQTPGGYMKADIVMIKRTPDGIEDVIVIENKLSQTTDFTTRQKEGWKKIANGEEMRVVYERRVTDNNKVVILEVNEKLKINSDRVFKISDHGKADLANTSLEIIDTYKFNVK